MAMGYDLLMQIIFTLDNAEERSGVYIICATNSPYNLHDAIFNILRSDKVTFDKFMYVPLPSPEERGMILKALARNKPIDADVDLMALGKDVTCENFRGAGLSSLMWGKGKF
ncbi:hypothetical protein C2S52_021018 [Perilla frutescens var. hirtella]|nr:hypothetical protein C2S52_021018 [Perilla frutescens var. hirtella]